MKSETDKGPPTEMPQQPDSHFTLTKKNVGKATKTNKGKDSAADKDDEETTTVKKAPEVRPENVETHGVAFAVKGKKGKGKKAGKKDAIENYIEAVLVAKVVEPETPVPEIEHEESAPVAESKGKKLRGTKVGSKKDFIEVQEHKESENLVAAGTDTKEKLCRGKQTSPKEGTEKPAKTSEDQLPNDAIESSLPAVPVVETKEKRGRDKRAVVINVSKADSEEEAVEEVAKAKGKKRVAITKKLVKVENKSAVPEEVAAPAEVMETIESPETVPAKKRRGKKAAGKKDAIEEAVVRAEPEEKAVEVTAGPKPKTGTKSKVRPKSRMETKPIEEEDKSPLVAEPEVAEKKGRGKKSHPSADSASQVASEMSDTPDEMDGPSSSGGYVASYDDRVRQRQQICSDKTISKAFEEIDTMAKRLDLTKAIVDKAMQNFKGVREGKQLKGYSTHLIASACLHIACRQEGRTITFKEICAVSSTEIKGMGKVFKKILKALETSVDIITIADFMPRFCLNLGLPINVQIVASHIGRRAMELDIVSGRSPLSVVAAAIYMASNASEMKLSKKEIRDVAGVSDVTIGQLYELMYPRAAELFPAELKLILSELPLH